MRAPPENHFTLAHVIRTHNDRNVGASNRANSVPEAHVPLNPTEKARKPLEIAKKTVKRLPSH
jgi:hypothetical protein